MDLANALNQQKWPADAADASCKLKNHHQKLPCHMVGTGSSVQQLSESTLPVWSPHMESHPCPV